MKAFYPIIAAIALIFAIGPTSELAYARASEDHFAILSDATVSERGKAAALRGALEVTRDEMAAIPPFAAAEKKNPGFLDELVQSLRPVFLIRIERLRKIQSSEMTSLYRQELTTDEAASLVEFFRSGVGMRMLDGAAQHLSSERLREVREVDEELLAAARDVAGLIFDATSEADRREFGRQYSANDGLKKFIALTPRRLAIMQRVSALPLSQEETARMQRITAEVFSRYR